MSKPRVCKKCGESFVPRHWETRYVFCASCRPPRPKLKKREKYLRLSDVARHRRPKGYGSKEYTKDNDLRKTYGITLHDYNAILQEQNGVCAICHGKSPNKRSLSVDHDHDTGDVRGLLCTNCNAAIGFVRENTETLENMIIYLKFYRNEPFWS